MRFSDNTLFKVTGYKTAEVPRSIMDSGTNDLKRKLDVSLSESDVKRFKSNLDSELDSIYSYQTIYDTKEFSLSKFWAWTNSSYFSDQFSESHLEELFSEFSQSTIHLYLSLIVSNAF